MNEIKIGRGRKIHHVTAKSITVSIVPSCNTIVLYLTATKLGNRIIDRNRDKKPLQKLFYTLTSATAIFRLWSALCSCACKLSIFCFISSNARATSGSLCCFRLKILLFKCYFLVCKLTWCSPPNLLPFAFVSCADRMPAKFGNKWSLLRLFQQRWSQRSQNTDRQCPAVRRVILSTGTLPFHSNM